MRYVDCVYRVHEQGEILNGVFDLQYGVIKDRTELFHIELQDKYDYVDEMYGEYSVRNRLSVSRQDLINTMCKKPNSLIVLNYNNIGAIIVYRDSVTHIIYQKQNVDFEVHKIQDPVQIHTMRILGNVKNKLKTLSVVQPYAKIIGVRWKDGIERVYTDDGVYKLEKGLSPYKDLDVEAYMDMLQDGNYIYGLANVRGKSVYLYKSGYRLIYSEPIIRL